MIARWKRDEPSPDWVINELFDQRELSIDRRPFWLRTDCVEQVARALSFRKQSRPGRFVVDRAVVGCHRLRLECRSLVPS
jgi:hypothetical protein